MWARSASGLLHYSTTIGFVNHAKVINMTQMVPVYFQTSRWLRGYLQKPFYANGYTARRASEYANDLLGQLLNPPAGAIYKLGVSDSPYTNFDYIRPEWIKPQGDLLLLPCGYPGERDDQAGKNNGEASYATWQYAFKKLFSEDGDFQHAAPYPLFSIIDTDSAHHLSAPLVEHAVQFADPDRLTGKPNRAMIVVNFDAHTDYGAKNLAPTITCQSWGRFVSNTIAEIHPHPLADAYVHFGLNTGDKETTWKQGE